MTPTTLPPLVARHWSSFLAGHPSLPLFFPSLARQARLKKAEWTVKAAGVQLASGAAVADLGRAARRDQGAGTAARAGHPQGRTGPRAGPPR